MTSTRIAEAKGILFLLLVIGLLAAVMMGASGKLEDWFGISIFRKPDVAGRICFVSDRNGHNDIWVMNRDGSGQKALTNDTFDDLSPVWSPDGTEIVFVSNRDGGRYQLFAMPYNGGRIRKLSLSTGTKSDPVFSPDGKQLAFLNSGRVSVRDVDGTHEHQILPSEEQARAAAMQDATISFEQIAWCAGGRYMAAIHRLHPGNAVILLDLKSGKSDVVKDDKDRPLVGARIRAAWANSGQRLAVSVIQGAQGNYVAVADMDREAFYTLLVGDNLKHAAIEPDWSPDDSYLVMVDADVDGSGETTPAGLLITDSSDGSTKEVQKGYCEHPKWSRDGKSIAYTKKAGGKRDVWLMDAETHKSINLTHGRGNSFDASWAPGVEK